MWNNIAARSAQEHIVDRAVHFASRLASAAWEQQDDTLILSSMGRRGERERPNLVADLVDNLDEAAQFDPMPFFAIAFTEVVVRPLEIVHIRGSRSWRQVALHRWTAGRIHQTRCGAFA